MPPMLLSDIPVSVRQKNVKVLLKLEFDTKDQVLLFDSFLVSL